MNLEILSTIINLVSSSLVINLGDYTSLYFYSAVFQGNAAVVALTAMYLIYKRQSIETSFDKKSTIAIEYLSKTTSTIWNHGDIWSFEFYNDEMFVKFDETIKAKAKETMNHDAWKARFSELHKLDNSKNILWQDAEISVRLIFVILGTSIMLLPFSIIIHRFFQLEFAFFILFIIFEIFALFRLYKFINLNSQ